MNYKVIYSKGLKKDDVKVRSFETQKEVSDFLVNCKDEYKEFLVCEFKKTDNEGVDHYRVLNKGSYILYKAIAYIVSFTVMVAIIAGFLYFRYWLIKHQH